MQFLLKLLLTNLVIITCVLMGKRYPHLGGLVATMPLTSLIVLVWLHADNPDDLGLLNRYTEGVLWGIVPTILFFAVAYFCFTRRLAFSLTLCAAFGAWFLGAALHQWLLR